MIPISTLKETVAVIGNWTLVSHLFDSFKKKKLNWVFLLSDLLTQLLVKSSKACIQVEFEMI
jgi:hypothetical protein